ncbi:MAG: FAD-binding oxidoreductase [Haliea sp.]
MGPDKIETDAGWLAYFSGDFSEILLERPAAVVRPGSLEEVVVIVKAARAHGVSVVPRGGGMSYSLGYAPARPGAVLLDMRALDRIVDIDTRNLTVTVEPGVTWKQLHEALLPTGYRIGFMGTMSGVAATIGGGLGNNATGHGRGDITDDLLGVEVVLADGSVLNTGGRATSPGSPVNRGYGPDFTGLFVGDCAAFGIRTQATFRLQRRPVGVAYACYGFQDPYALADALCDVERSGLAVSNMAFSDYHHRVFAGQSPTAAERRAMIRDLRAASATPVRFARNMLTLARGMKFLAAWPHSVTSIVEGYDQREAQRRAQHLGRLMRHHGGKRLNPSLGVVLTAQPFVPIDKLIVGIDGECSFPSNFTVPLDRARDALKLTDDFFARNEADMERYGITWTRLLLTLKGMFGMEPIIYWRDRMNPLRYDVLSSEHRSQWGERPADDEARACAIDLRKRLVAELECLQPVHFQIGKFYDYQGALASESERMMLAGFKDLVDCNRVMNPGALGLG